MAFLEQLATLRGEDADGGVGGQEVTIGIDFLRAGLASITAAAQT